MAYARFCATGKLPSAPKPPCAPLIDLLLKIPPRERSYLHGVQIGPELGYLGGRTFHTASQALLWLRPNSPESHPASESWRNKRFGKPLFLDDLLPHCASFPDGIQTRLAHLLSPEARRALQPVDSHVSPALVLSATPEAPAAPPAGRRP